MGVNLTILGSGSGGNCAYLETPEARILIDAGFSARQIRLRLAGIGRDAERLDGIFITHEHSDHIQGLGVLASKLRIPVYCNRLTAEALKEIIRHPLNFRIVETGSVIPLGDIEITSFNVPHDALDPVNFLIRTSEGCIGFLTDLGHATQLVRQRVREADVLLLEANHDLRLLQDDTRRPWSLKQRILSRHGHLSNEAAASALAEGILTDRLKHLYLGHLSRDCNRPELAEAAIREKLDQLGVRNLPVEVTCQATPSPSLALASLGRS